jgi:hypothetical protein
MKISVVFVIVFIVSFSACNLQQGADKVPPTVTSTSPVHGSTDVPVDTTEIAINFSEPMNTNFVSISTFGLPEDSQFAWFDTDTCGYTMINSFEFSKQVTLILNPSSHNPGILDLAGNPLQMDYEYTFRTVDPVATVIPLATIILDGIDNDWTGISHIIEDPINDDDPDTAGADLQFIFSAADASYIYICMQVNGSPGVDAGYSYRLHMRSDVNGWNDNDLECRIDWNEGNQEFHVGCNKRSGDTWVPIPDDPGGAYIDDTVEMRIPISNLPSNPFFTRCFVWGSGSEIDKTDWCFLEKT